MSNDDASQKPDGEFDIRSIIDPEILRMMQYKAIVGKERDLTEGEKQLQIAIRRCLDTMTNVAGAIDIPDDYVKISVNGKCLSTFAFLGALPIFKVEGEKMSDNIIEVFYYAIDALKKIVYINEVRVTVTPDQKPDRSKN